MGSGITEIHFTPKIFKLYHDIGKDILERQTRQGWGSKVIDKLASDLSAAFPEMRVYPPVI